MIGTREALSVQDDSREVELREKFGLVEPENRSRGGTDAELCLGELRIPFELKSTTKNSITTVRDFGPDHLKTWDGKHWLMGWYRRQKRELCLEKVYYGSPADMEPWIKRKWNYMLPDFQLSEELGPLVDTDILKKICGDKELYTLKDAERIQKKQYRKAEYLERMDVSGGYSQERMLEILRDRVTYLIKRGSTLNNPHIPGKFIEQNCKIVRTPEELKTRVLEFLNRPAD